MGLGYKHGGECIKHTTVSDEEIEATTTYSQYEVVECHCPMVIITEIQLDISNVYNFQDGDATAYLW